LADLLDAIKKTKKSYRRFMVASIQNAENQWIRGMKFRQSQSKKMQKRLRDFKYNAN
jgi:hypothetical protein